MSGGGGGRGRQGGRGSGRRVQHAAMGRRRTVAHLLRGQVLHTLLLVPYGEVWGGLRRESRAVTTAAGGFSVKKQNTPKILTMLHNVNNVL